MKGCVSGGAAARQRLDQEAMRGPRRCRIGEVGDDAGMRSVEIARGVAQIGLLGDRQRDDADARVGQRVEQRGRDLRGATSTDWIEPMTRSLSPSLPRSASV